MPTTGYKLSELLDNNTHNVYKVETIVEAVKLAYRVTSDGKSCLLSPAAASYEAFTNFEEKGSKYKEYIEMYK
jgi:UDP-N-acetylmuramoylalanine--D-glutamate ligase